MPTQLVKAPLGRKLLRRTRGADSYPAPTLSVATAVRWSAGLVVTLTGVGFSGASVARMGIGGTALPTVYVSPT